MNKIPLTKSLKIIDFYKSEKDYLQTPYKNDLAVHTELSKMEKLQDVWLTSREAADYLRISTRTLYNLTSSGKVKYHKFGRRNRFKLDDLKSK